MQRERPGLIATGRTAAGNLSSWVLVLTQESSLEPPIQASISLFPPRGLNFPNGGLHISTSKAGGISWVAPLGELLKLRGDLCGFSPPIFYEPPSASYPLSFHNPPSSAPFFPTSLSSPCLWGRTPFPPAECSWEHPVCGREGAGWIQASGMS